MNRFATKILFCPLTDDDGTYWVNIANVCYYREAETEGESNPAATDIYMINGQVLTVSMAMKEFTKMLQGEAK